jgi:tetratricopeptide (TPR) repeat protein
VEAKKEKRRQFTVSAAMGKKLIAASDSLKAEEYEQAREILDALEARAKRLNPYERALTFQMLGFLESSQDQYEAALGFFEKSLVEDALPEGAQVSMRFNVAQLYLATEQYASALKTLERWFEEAEKPTSVAYYLMALAHYQLGEIRQAIQPALRAIKMADEPKEPWYQLLAGLYFENKQYSKAVAPLKALVALNPKKSYLTQLSALYANVGKEEKALAVLQLAYQEGYLDRDNELRQLAQLYLYHGLPYRAGTVLEKGLEEERIEADAKAWEMLANSWLMARELDRALDPLAKAAALAEDGNVYARLGQVLLEQESWSDAAAALAKALEKGALDDEGTANLLLGISLYHQDRRQQARRYFGAAQASESARESAVKWLRLLDRESQKS